MSAVPDEKIDIESELNQTAEPNGVENEEAVNETGKTADVAQDDEMAKKDEEIRNYIGRIQRLQADFENYKKRIAREHANLTTQIENRVYKKMLPLFDSFHRAFAAHGEHSDDVALAEGMKQIFSQFEELLKSEEIVAFESVGVTFDPVKHEALMSVESEEPPNTILEEFERGYQRGEAVLRPSRVKVSRKPSNQEGNEQANKEVN